MPFGESAVAIFKAIAMIVVEPVQNAIAVSASAPSNLLADRVEFADYCRPAPRQRENDSDSPGPPEEIGACACVLTPQPRFGDFRERLLLVVYVESGGLPMR
jgi:hypothetical protein